MIGLSEEPRQRRWGEGSVSRLERCSTCSCHERVPASMDWSPSEDPRSQGKRSTVGQHRMFSKPNGWEDSKTQERRVMGAQDLRSRWAPNRAGAWQLSRIRYRKLIHYTSKNRSYSLPRRLEDTRMSTRQFCISLDHWACVHLKIQRSRSPAFQRRRASSILDVEVLALVIHFDVPVHEELLSLRPAAASAVERITGRRIQR